MANLNSTDFVFDIDARDAGSSGEAFSVRPPPRALSETAEALDESASPIFKLLSRPDLPELKHETSARLMMQSPTRLYFYWSVSSHSFQALRTTIGDNVGDYRLALRLLDLTHETEEVYSVEREGNWWFNVQPDTEYRAEVGFYSASRPFVRVLFSNTIVTPRKSPSPRSAAEAQWAVTTHKFAELLDASGFEADAFDVRSDEYTDEIASRFAEHVGVERSKIDAVDETELRRALGLLATGSPIEDLKFKITAELYALLQEHLAQLSAGSIRTQLGVTDKDSIEFETFSAVGGSLVNIPRRRFRPVSSSNLG